MLYLRLVAKGQLPPPPSENSASEAISATNSKHTQKVYTFDKETLISMIKTFESQAEEVKKPTQLSRSSSLSSSDSLSLDSALYLIEAALNYDFDFNDQYTFTRNTDFSEFDQTVSCNANNTKIKTSDLATAYNNFHSSVNALITSDKKVRLIDIQVDVTQIGNLGFRAQSYFQFGFGTNPSYNCTNYNGMAGSLDANNGYQLLENQLKFCNYSNPINCYKVFVTNVTSAIFQQPTLIAFGTIPTNNIYRQDWFTSQGAPNPVDLTPIPNNTMNNYVTDCTSFINTNTPVGKTLFQITVNPDFTWFPILNMTANMSRWRLEAKYCNIVVISGLGC